MSSMFKWLWLFWGRETLMRELKRRSLVVYLRIVRSTRLTVLTVFAIGIFLQVMVLSAVGALVTGFILWNHDFAAKMEILFWIFTGTFAVPAILLAILMSEYFWLRISGAKRLMDSVRD